MGVGSRRVLGQLLLGIVWRRGCELKGARGVGESVGDNEAVCACKKDVFERVGGHASGEACILEGDVEMEGYCL